MRPTIPLTVSSHSIYFCFKKQALPAHYAGTVASLPLFFEVTSDISKQFLERIDPLIEKFTASAVSNIINSKVQPLYGVHVLHSDTFLYIPQVITRAMWHSTSNYGDNSSLLQPNYENSAYFPVLPIINIRTTQHLRCTLTDIATFDFESQDTHYGIPSITSFSFSTHLRTQIYTRYYARPDAIDSPTYTDYKAKKQNIIIDSYLPFSLCDYDATDSWYDQSTLASKRDIFRAISPLTADLFGIKQIPLTDILYKVLDLSPEYLSEIFNTVKRRKLIINFAGTGGTGINTIYWLNQLVSLFQIHELFREVHLFETDCVDLSNIFRFPLPLSTYTTTIMPASKKVNLIVPYVDDLCRYTYCHDSYLTSLSDFPSYQLNPDNTIKPNIITYGAPSVSNRNFLSSVGNFISGTHANNTASLYINPVADETLQVETYGLIQLNSFFINQIRMAIGLIEILATNQETLQDTLFSDYTFLAQTKGSYTFNISEQMPAREIGDN